MTADDYPIDRVRSQFPGLTSGWAFFDNAGGSLPLGRVIDDAADYMRRWPVQLGATYAVSAEAAERMTEAARAAAAFVNAGRPEEIVFGPSTTALIGRLARAMQSQFSDGDEIIITDVDHDANRCAWLRLADHGVVIRHWLPNRDSGRLEPDELEALLSERTRLVCFTHASNILGHVEPLESITRLAHAHGAKVCVDGVAYAPHRLIDVRAWDVDYYAFSYYKVFGPHVAVMYGKYALLQELDSINHFVVSRGSVPHKLQPGGVCYELVHATHSIGPYLAELGEPGGGYRAALAAGFDVIARHEAGLTGRLLDYLDTQSSVTLVGVKENDTARLPTVSFVIDGVSSADIPKRIDDHLIGIRYGDFYAGSLIDVLGIRAQRGVVRVSMAHYNTGEELDRLIAACDAEVFP